VGDFYGCGGASDGEMNFKAAKTSALLCLLFVVVYGGTNWLTAQRQNVGTFYFAWERHIPFVPAMIVPYMSIDLFFIAAPFLCRSDRERRVLTARIATAILIAGACFVAFPLRFAFDRPHVDGVLGLIFNNFRGLDRPFNQFPSLHIVLQIVLLEIYWRHTRGVERAAVGVWFIVIGISAMLTYQHHFIDIAGGLALGGLCLGIVQEHRAGLYYGVGAVLLATVAILWRPWGFLLLWPAISLALMAAAYFRFGAGIFQKHGGVLSKITYLLLWPILIGQRISLTYYAARSHPWDELTDRLWIGRKLSDGEAQNAVERGVASALDLTGEFSEARPFRRLVYRQLPILDLTAPTGEQLNQAVAFVRGQIEHGVVYIHCKAGYSRTAAVAGAYLLDSGHAQTADEAIRMLRSARPGIVIRPEIIRALHEYDRCELAAIQTSR
jgi:membrane-associated phospholipid phosphatase